MNQTINRIVALGRQAISASWAMSKDAVVAARQMKFAAMPLIGAGVGAGTSAASSYYDTGGFDRRSLLRGAMWGGLAGLGASFGRAAWGSPARSAFTKAASGLGRQGRVLGRWARMNVTAGMREAGPGMAKSSTAQAAVLGTVRSNIRSGRNVPQWPRTVHPSLYNRIRSQL
jgi:hypothetical protein